MAKGGFLAQTTPLPVRKRQAITFILVNITFRMRRFFAGDFISEMAGATRLRGVRQVKLAMAKIQLYISGVCLELEALAVA